MVVGTFHIGRPAAARRIAHEPKGRLGQPPTHVVQIDCARTTHAPTWRLVIDAIRRVQAAPSA